MAMDAILKPRARCCVRIGLSTNGHRHVVQRDTAGKTQGSQQPDAEELVSKPADSAGTDNGVCFNAARPGIRSPGTTN